MGNKELLTNIKIELQENSLEYTIQSNDFTSDIAQVIGCILEKISKDKKLDIESVYNRFTVILETFMKQKGYIHD